MSSDQSTSRRYFLKYLAASPLFASTSMATVAAWAEGPSVPTKLPDPVIWAPGPLDQIKSPKEAINVFDFEPVARKNVPPAHFG